MVAPSPTGNFRLQAAMTENAAKIIREAQISSLSSRETRNRARMEMMAVRPMSCARTMVTRKRKTMNASPLFPLMRSMLRRMVPIRLVFPKA